MTTDLSSTHADGRDWIIETDRLRLRAITVNDTALMLAVWNDPAFMRNVADRGIRSDEQARVAIESGAQKLFETYGYGPYCMSLKSTGSMIGIEKPPRSGLGAESKRAAASVGASPGNPAPPAILRR